MPQPDNVPACHLIITFCIALTDIGITSNFAAFRTRLVSIPEQAVSALFARNCAMIMSDFFSDLRPSDS